MAAAEDQKRKTGKDRIEYFWMFYKIPAILVVISIIAAVSFIHAWITNKPSVLDAMLLDIHSDVTEENMEQDFVEAAGINPDRNCVTISTSQLLGDGSRDYQMASLAKLYSQIGTGTLDVVSMRESDFVKYVDAGTFLDLRDLFTDKELSAFGHVYRDEDGKILGIYCEGMAKMKEIGGYSSGENGIIGILYNSEHVEMAGKFLQYLNESE